MIGVYPGIVRPADDRARRDRRGRGAPGRTSNASTSPCLASRSARRTAPTSSRRQRALERLVAGRPELGVVVTDAQLITDIAAGYDVVVMGADKWAQVNDPAWYRRWRARDAALARLPRVLVAPRPGFATSGAEILALDADHGAVSSTAARAGQHDYVSPAARRRLIVDAMNVIGSRGPTAGGGIATARPAA